MDAPARNSFRPVMWGFSDDYLVISSFFQSKIAEKTEIDENSV